MASLDFACTFWYVNWLLCWYGKLLCQGLGQLNSKLLDYQSAVSCENCHLVRGGYLLSLSPISSPYVPHLFIAFSHRFPSCSQISDLFPRCFLGWVKIKDLRKPQILGLVEYPPSNYWGYPMTWSIPMFPCSFPPRISPTVHSFKVVPPPVISWFITSINSSYWSHVHQLS